MARMKKLDLTLSVQDHLYLAGPYAEKISRTGTATQITPGRLISIKGFWSWAAPTRRSCGQSFLVFYHFLTRDTMQDGVYGEMSA